MLKNLTLESIESSLGTIAIFFFPGLFMLDVIFDRGLMSGNISSIYQFILLLLYGFVLSLPLVLVNIAVLNHGEPMVPVDNEEDRVSDFLQVPILTLVALLIAFCFNLFSKLISFKSTIFSSEYLSFALAYLLAIIIQIGMLFPYKKLVRKVLLS